MSQQTLIKAEIVLMTENEAAQHYLFHKLEHYPEIEASTKDRHFILIGDGAYIGYILEVLKRQVAKRFKDTTLLVLSYQFVFCPSLLLDPSKEC